MVEARANGLPWMISCAIAALDRPQPCLPPINRCGLPSSLGSDCKISMHRSDNTTRCSRPFLTRPFGINHVFSVRLISDHRAPTVSPVRAAVRMVNSSANAANPMRRITFPSAAIPAPPCATLSATMNSGISSNARVGWCSTSSVLLSSRDARTYFRLPRHAAGLSPSR